MPRNRPVATSSPPPRTRLGIEHYALLARFRYALRGFLRFSEVAAAEVGLTTRHYQALLVLRGCPADQRVSISALAEQLLIRHNSAVGLVDRLYKQGLVARDVAPNDARKVHLRLTARGTKVLERLASVHRTELRRIGPQLRALLDEISGGRTQTPR